MQQRCMQIVNVNSIFYYIEAQIIRRADHLPRLDAAAFG
jgi:hypothetical protein